jgi:ferredoxin-NADP reductase
MANPIKMPAMVSTIRNHGEGVYTVVLTPSKKIPRFKPGQFLHLTVDDYDPAGGFWPESRVFSIASSPTSENIVVVYSVKGKYTRKIQRELCEGRSVWLKLPYGDFSIGSHAAQSQDVILVAGGTGISPFVSFLENEILETSIRKVSLVYGVRKREHILFADTIARCRAQMSNFTLDLFLEDPASIEAPLQVISPLPGRITVDRILDISAHLQNPAIFLSGPPQMILSFRTDLVLRGTPAQNIKIDEWE